MLLLGVALGVAGVLLLYVYFRRKSNAGPPYGPGGKPWWLWGACVLVAFVPFGCASLPLKQQDAHVEALYLPKLTHHSVGECKRRFHSKSFCEWYGGADIADDCQPGYHMERQWATGGFGAALIPTSRLVCHRDDLKRAATARGLECAQ